MIRSARLAGLALLLCGSAIIAITSPPSEPRAPRTKQGDEAADGPLQLARARASRSIDKIFAGDAPMAKALLVADRHSLPPEMRDRYARAGMAHILSISGLHVAIVASAVILLLQAARLPAQYASLLGMVLTAFYVAVIGAPASAVRSAAMLSAVAASKAAQRPISPWAGLALGAFAPLVSPRTVLDLGYQLSVAGIAGIIASQSLSERLLAPRLAGWKLRLGSDLMISAVATLVTAPLIAWYFGRVSLIGPIANLAAGPVIAVLQPMLFLALALAPATPVATFVADAAHPLLRLFDGIATTAASIPGGSAMVVPTMVTAIAGGGAVAGLIAAAVSRRPASATLFSAGCLCVLAWSPAIHGRPSSGIEMHVLDVGQGDAILFRTDRGNWIVFDAGRVWRSGDAGRAVIIPYIMKRGGTVAAFVLSHAHADHIGGAASIFRALRPAEFWDAAFTLGSGVYAEALRAAKEEGVTWRRVHPGDSMRVDGIAVRFLAPDSAWTASLGDPNEASTIALVEYGTSRFLLMGDAERAEERWLVDHAREELHADVLKVGHHGSSTSSTDEFLSVVRPSLAVISVGADNLYGHPSADVLASLNRVGAHTVRTDAGGTIVVRTDGRRITYSAGGETWDISRQ